MDIEDGRLVIETASLQDTLTDLLVWAQRSGVHIEGLDARAASLEAVFLSIADEFDDRTEVAA